MVSGTTNDGRFFLVTELLAGGSLFALLATETEISWDIRTRMWLHPHPPVQYVSLTWLDLSERAKNVCNRLNVINNGCKNHH